MGRPAYPWEDAIANPDLTWEIPHALNLGVNLSPDQPGKSESVSIGNTRAD